MKNKPPFYTNEKVPMAQWFVSHYLNQSSEARKQVDSCSNSCYVGYAGYALRIDRNTHLNISGEMPQIKGQTQKGLPF